MPLFRTNKDIFKDRGEEAFESRFMDSNVIQMPKNGKWDYGDILRPERVEIWEVIFEDTWGWGIYAAWEPYAELYMVRTPPDMNDPHSFTNTIYDCYYGPGAQDQIMKFMVEHNIPFGTHKIWVDEEDMWLYNTNHESSKIITFGK